MRPPKREGITGTKKAKIRTTPSTSPKTTSLRLMLEVAGLAGFTPTDQNNLTGYLDSNSSRNALNQRFRWYGTRRVPHGACYQEVLDVRALS